MSTHRAIEAGNGDAIVGCIERVRRTGRCTPHAPSDPSAAGVIRRSSATDAEQIVAGGEALRGVGRPGGSAMRPNSTNIPLRPPANGGGGRPNPLNRGGAQRPNGGGTIDAITPGGGGGARPPGGDPGSANRIDRDRARALMLEGNNKGVIALLDGARDQQELELLVTASAIPRPNPLAMMNDAIV